jgi:hypothetical protein
VRTSQQVIAKLYTSAFPLYFSSTADISSSSVCSEHDWQKQNPPQPPPNEMLWFRWSRMIVIPLQMIMINMYLGQLMKSFLIWQVTYTLFKYKPYKCWGTQIP